MKPEIKDLIRRGIYNLDIAQELDRRARETWKIFIRRGK